MSKSNTFETDWLKLIFNRTPIANIADDAVSSPLTNLYIALHTDDPTDTGDQTTLEIAYTGYARVAVARSTGGWSVIADKVYPVNPITFGACTAGSTTAKFWSVGTATTGTGKILYSGAVAPWITIGTGVTPQLTVGSYVQED